MKTKIGMRFTQMSFLADRYHQLSDDLAQFGCLKDFLVADYHIFKSLIFCQDNLGGR
jgi:deoxyadenosine/deoxycytidine kinase